MAVRPYRDAKGRARYLVEFAQSGVRVLRRLHPGATRQDATELETKLRGDIFRQGSLGEKPEISLEEAIARWLRDDPRRRKDTKTVLSKASLLTPFVSVKSLGQAPTAAQEAVTAWGSAGLAAATINRRLCVLKAACRHAWKQGWIDENLSGRISLLPEHNARQVYLTKAQVSKLANSTKCRATATAIWTLAYTGLRVSELLSVRDDTALRKGTLTVVSIKGGKKLTRTVPVPLPARGYVRSWAALSERPSYWQLEASFSTAREAAGMPHVHIHDLRHTAASWLINSGADLYVVGRILGHTSTQTTSRYSHLADKTLRRAMSKLK